MSIYNEQIITPENLHRIVIQYQLPQSGFQPGIPSFSLVYGTPERQQQIILAEVQNYIKYLQIRAALENTSVVALQDSSIKTVITLGAPEGNGFPIIGQSALEGQNVCNRPLVVYYINHAGLPEVGDVIYTDIALTSPLTGRSTFASSNGTQFNIGAITGLLTSETGDTCTTPDESINVDFQINGVDFDGSNFLTGVDNVNSVTSDKTINGKSPFIVSFRLPVRNIGGFTNYVNTNTGLITYGDYSLPSNCTILAVERNSSNWFVTLAYYGSSTTLDFLNSDAISVEIEFTGQTISGANPLLKVWDDNEERFYNPESGVPMKVVVTGASAGQNGMYFGNVSEGCRGQITYRQYEGITLVEEVTNKAWEDVDLIVFSLNVTRIEFEVTQVLLSSKPSDLFVGFIGLTQRTIAGLYSYVTGNGDQTDLSKVRGSILKIYLGHPSTFDYKVALFKNNGLLYTHPDVLLANVFHNLALPSMYNDYDEIKIYENGTGVPVLVQYNNNEGTVCADIPSEVFTDDGDITTGKTVYIDSALTTPLAGFTFIVNPLSGIIYNIDTFTGVIGAATGNSC